jgi:hypothetical protein
MATPMKQMRRPVRHQDAPAFPIVFMPGFKIATCSPVARCDDTRLKHKGLRVMRCCRGKFRHVA